MVEFLKSNACKRKGNREARSMFNDSDSNAVADRHIMELVDDMMLRRTAFEFLKTKKIFPGFAQFTENEAEAKIIKDIVVLDSSLPEGTCSGTKICFHNGCSIVFDSDSYVVLLIEGNGVLTLMNGRDERLNLAERIDMLAFPIHRAERENATKPAANNKCRPGERINTIAMIPNECLLWALSFAVSMQDVMPMMNVCKRWRHLLMDESIWKLLCLKYYPVLEQVHQAIQEPDVTWRQLFLDRARHLKARFRRNEEDENRDRYDYFEEYRAFEPAHFEAYKNGFTLVLWDKLGRSTELKVKPELCGGANIRLELDGFSLLSFTWLEIFVQRSLETTSYILYSGSIDQSNKLPVFDSYNRFEKFRAKSFFVGLRQPNVETDKARIAIPSVKPFLFSGTTNNPSLYIQLSWQVELKGAGIPMSVQDVLVFLEKGLDAAKPSNSAARPPAQSENWAMSRFSPRPLKSYGVLVDYRMDISDTLPCMRDIVSCYYEPAVFATANDNRFSLRLPLPTECHWMISEGMNSDEGNYISVVIYVVDKISGRQALLYSGTSTGEYMRKETFIICQGRGTLNALTHPPFLQ